MSQLKFGHLAISFMVVSLGAIVFLAITGERMAATRSPQEKQQGLQEQLDRLQGAH